ncbi:hypothetical protein M569_15989 [Genlisea aurea]|uniref:Bet v I/Major latex protein domain-containing protein n=1 Tax=Genlisea aurea TaxID=192259 RepID=S8BW38_9LAMI|nr:hypothetical protein M569_15989 [Genlisea aurea]
MGARGRLVVGHEFPSSKGDIFYQVLKNNPHRLSASSPQFVQGCKVEEGEFGKPGSVIVWTFTHEGKESVAKEVIERVDDENRVLSFRIVEGEVLDQYEEFLTTFRVEPSRDGKKDYVTWTFEYETRGGDVEPPFALEQTAFGVIVNFEKSLP